MLTCTLCGAAVEQWCLDCLEPVEALNAEQASRFLLDAHSRVLRASRSGNTPLPEAVVLTAETGRGKTFAVQRFLDQLISVDGGYWPATTAPRWPPTAQNEVHRARKTVAPPAGSPEGRPPFLWLGLSCGELEGPRRVDPAAQLVGQLLVQATALANSAGDLRRRKALERALLGFGADLALGSAGMVVDAGKRALQYLRERSPESTFDVMALQLRELLASIREVSSDLALVAVLDDAHAVDDDTLRLLSVLVGAEGGTSADQDEFAQAGYLTGDVEPLAPVLFVATAWPHRSQGAFADTPFAHWMTEAEELKMLTEVEIRDLTCQEALEKIESPGLGGGLEERLVDHICNEIGRIVPLVMAEDIAQLESRRDPLSKEIVVDDSFIDGLPTDPEYHLRDRLHALEEDESGDGAEALAVLRRLALWGSRPPLSFVRLILEDAEISGARSAANRVVGLLSRHQLLQIDDEPKGADPDSPSMRIRQVTLDADIARYLAEDPGLERDVKRASTQVLEEAFQSLEHELRWGEPIAWRSVLEALRPGVRLLDLEEDGLEDPDLLVFAAVLAKQYLPEKPEAMTSTGHLIWHLYFDEADTDEVIAHISRSTPSRWAVSSARTLLTRPISARQLEDLDDGLGRLEQQSGVRVGLRMARADCLGQLGRYGEAISTLEPFSAHSEQAAMKLVDLLEQRKAPGWEDEAISVLEPLSSRSQNVALRLAGLLERRGEQGWVDEAIAALEPLSVRHADVALGLVGLLEDRGQQGWVDEAVSVLRPLSSRNEKAAAKLADLLESGGYAGWVDDAISVLEPLSAANEQAALRLVGLLERRGEQGWVDEAISVLEPLSARYPDTALKLADLLERRGEPGWVDDAIRLLDPVVRFQPAAYRLALLLVGNGELERAKALSDSWGSSYPFLLGVSTGISVLEGSQPHLEEEVSGVNSTQQFVSAVGKVFRASRLETPTLWRQFFGHRWTGNVLAAATRYVAGWIAVIARQGYPDTPIDRAITRAVDAIWPNRRNRDGAGRYLARQLDSWVDRDFPIGHPLAIDNVENLLAIVETHRRLAAETHASLPRLVERLTLITEDDPDLVDRLKSFREWSLVASRVLENVASP